MPRTNTILTQQTYRHIHELVDLLYTLPLRDMKITTAFRSLHRPDETLLLREDQKQWLRAQIAQLTEIHPDGKIKFQCSTDYQAMTAGQRERAFDKFPSCGIGMDTIIITPDGKVSMCEQSPQSEEFIVGNVKENAIMDVWQCDRMKAFINVRRSSFKGTVCYDCDDFDRCLHKKGGCFILSMKAYGTRFAPHPACPKAPPYAMALE